MPFCNQNGITEKMSGFCDEIGGYRSGCKKCQIFGKKLEMESTDHKLSKTDPQMFLNLLDPNL